jgi:hypothetical protein
MDRFMNDIVVAIRSDGMTISESDPLSRTELTIAPVVPRSDRNPEFQFRGMYTSKIYDGQDRIVDANVCEYYMSALGLAESISKYVPKGITTELVLDVSCIREQEIYILFLDVIASSGVNLCRVEFAHWTPKISTKIMKSIKPFLRKTRYLVIGEDFDDFALIKKIFKNAKIAISFLIHSRTSSHEENKIIKKRFDFMKSVRDAKLSVLLGGNCDWPFFIHLMLDLIMEGEQYHMTFALTDGYLRGLSPVGNIVRSYNKETNRTEGIETLTSSVLSWQFLYCVARFV